MTMNVLPVLICRDEELAEIDFEAMIEELKGTLTSKAQLLAGVIVNGEEDLVQFSQHVQNADAILLYKPHLGLGSCVVKIAEQNLPLILFNSEENIGNPLDALEYIYPRPETWVAVDYQHVNFLLKLLEVRKKLRNTKLLVLNADYPHWERWLCRVRGGVEAIREKFGITVEGILSSEVLKRWQNVAEEKINSVVEKWKNEAKMVIEPKQADLNVVARLYLVIWDLLNERDAQGLTMAYGDATVEIFPVPCLAYMNLRDERIPSACEADIISLITMTILHYLTDKPSFMGNVFVDLGNNAIMLSHCVAPRKMAGYSAAPASYVLRDQHWGHFLGSVSAFVEMEPDQEVTICRLSGDLNTMLISRGMIMDCRDLEGYCRMTVRIKIQTPVKNFIQKTSGNHHVMVYGDYQEELRELNKLFGITTIEV